jgi:hypothetical protein
MADSGIHHVWIIELENTTFSQNFGRPSADPELARVLVSKGALLRDYYGIGHDSLGYTDPSHPNVTSPGCTARVAAGSARSRYPRTSSQAAPGTGVR